MFSVPHVDVSSVLTPEGLEYTETILSAIRTAWWEKAQERLGCTKSTPLRAEDLAGSLLDTLVSFSKTAKSPLTGQFSAQSQRFRELADQAIASGGSLRAMGEAMLWDRFGEVPIGGQSECLLAYTIAELVNSVGTRAWPLDPVQTVLYQTILQVWDYSKWVFDYTAYDTQIGGKFSVFG